MGDKEREEERYVPLASFGKKAIERKKERKRKEKRKKRKEKRERERGREIERVRERGSRGRKREGS